MSQPRVASSLNFGCESCVRVGSAKRIEVVSTTERPRLHFPPSVLALSDCQRELGKAKGKDGRTCLNQVRALVGRLWD